MQASAANADRSPQTRARNAALTAAVSSVLSLRLQRQVARGVACTVCHGLGTRSAGLAPDLRESAVAVELTSFSAVLHDGGLEKHGMPRFADLTSDEGQALYEYVRAKSREQPGAGPSVPDVLGFGRH